MGSIYLLKCKATKSLDYLIINSVLFLLSRITRPSISVSNTYEHIISYYGCNFYPDLNTKLAFNIIYHLCTAASIISASLHLSSIHIYIIIIIGTYFKYVEEAPSLVLSSDELE